MKKNKGITLMALIVTIIILLILAGISIISLNGNNGLITKSKQAKEKYSISQAKEKLTTKLMQLQTEMINDEGRNAKLDDINKLIDSNSKYYDKEIEDVKDKEENKLVKMSGYYFEVDSKLNILGNIDDSELSVTETTYKVNSINGNIMNVTINIKNKIGIQKVIKPDNSEITPVGTKEEISIDYDVEDGKEYKFKVQLVGNNEQKEYTLKANLNAKPEIKQNESNAYPLLTEYGVEINKIVKIDFGENTNNYYSLDNGNSWTKYTEDGISMEKEGIILVKSVVDGEITKEVQENVTMQLADNALGAEAYDNDDTTSYVFRNGSRYMMVDKSAIGKKIYFSLNPLYLAYGMQATIKFTDFKGDTIGETYNSVYSTNYSIVIPTRTEKIEITVTQAYNVNNFRIDNIKE